MCRIFLISIVALLFLAITCSDNGTDSNLQFELSWQRALFDSSGTIIIDALQAPDGTIYVLTQKEGAGDTWSIEILKIDDEANISDTIEVSPTLDESPALPRSFALTSDNSFLITGYSGTSNTQFMVLRAGINGTIESDTSFGGSGNEFGLDISETSTGGAALGWTGSLSGYSSALMMCVFDENGEVQDTKTYTNGNETTGYALVEGEENGLVMVGTTENSGNNTDILVLAVDSQGDTEWAKQLGGSGNDFGLKILSESDGYIIGGFTGSFGSGGYDMYLSKVDDTGRVIWENAYGGSAYESIQDLVKTSDGGYLMIGQASGNEVGTIIYKVSSDGSTVWNTLVDDSLDHVTRVFEIDANSVAVLGDKELTDGSRTGYLELITIDGL